MQKVLDPPQKPATARRTAFAPAGAPNGKSWAAPVPAARPASAPSPARPPARAVPRCEPRDYAPGEFVPTPADLPAVVALLERLFGPVPLGRVVWDPFPGTATLEDCERFNEAGHLCELVDGVLLEKIVGFTESEIATFLAERVGRWDPDRRRGRRTGEAGFVELPSGRVRGPDYSFFLHRRFLSGGALPPNSVGSVKIPAVTPDFAVEILSEGNTREEIDHKLDDLFAAGCRLAWVVDPRARTARVVTPADDDNAERPWAETTADDSATLTGDPVLPGFAVSLAELLAAPDGAGEAAGGPDPAANPGRTGG